MYMYVIKNIYIIITRTILFRKLHIKLRSAVVYVYCLPLYTYGMYCKFMHIYRIPTTMTALIFDQIQ